MKHLTSAFYSDKLFLTHHDLKELLAGKDLEGNGLVVSLELLKELKRDALEHAVPPVKCKGCGSLLYDMSGLTDAQMRQMGEIFGVTPHECKEGRYEIP